MARRTKSAKEVGGAEALVGFHAPTRAWFEASFDHPTRAQALGWPVIQRGESALILAPTGSGKTLAAFLAAIDRLAFEPAPPAQQRCRVLYISPLKALAVDVERNLRAPLAGVLDFAERLGAPAHAPQVAVRTGDTPSRDRAAFLRKPADILITTPESLYLLLTGQARDALRYVRTVILDEVHAVAGTKRGAHLALSLERLEALTGAGLQRIGLSATVRPIEEIARFLGGFDEPRSHEDAKASRSNDGPRASATPHASRVTNRDTRLTHHAPARPVTIVDAGRAKRLDLIVEVPVVDMAAAAATAVVGADAGRERPPRRSDSQEPWRRGSAAVGVSKPPGRALDVRPRNVIPATHSPAAPTFGVAARAAESAAPPIPASIWPAMHPLILRLIREHRSTLVFVNSRRLAERLAAALNEQAGEEIVRAHHGSIAREKRLEIEEELKAGRLPAIVATSSLELGIDMGAIDLVIQVECPPSVASGIQRIGRAGHQIDAPSKGVILPKYRGDLLACATLTARMQEGAVEEMRYLRNPLDVLAQQIVAMVAVQDWCVDDLERVVRGAAPFAEITRPTLEEVLDMLSGRYPADDFAELRPRITWDRLCGVLRARQGARLIAVTNAGTIPDRGLYGVYLAGADKGPASRRVGELDEEMVFETRVGDVFLLGASSWRVEEITADRVLVSPAPGAAGRMPFWHGESAGRPLEFGRAIGALTRELREMPEDQAIDHLRTRHALDPAAAACLLGYLADQARATGACPDDRTIVVESYMDEMGDWRVCILSPFGSRVHAPWAMAIGAMFRERSALEVDILWTDDGIIVRFPGVESPPPIESMLPHSTEVEDLVVRQLGHGGGGVHAMQQGAPVNALFASRFREAAARALLLPRRSPSRRSPLWQQRRRAADLMQTAAKFSSFPIVLEAFRECLKDVFDMPALVELLREIEVGAVSVIPVTSHVPSPFASALLFNYVANFMYEGDAPLAERRAQALLVDPALLRELLGDAELRDLLDPEAITRVERWLQHLTPERAVRHPDGLHDLLLRLGDLTREEIGQRCAPGEDGRVPVDGPPRTGEAEPSRVSRDASTVETWLSQLQREIRVIPITVDGQQRFIAAEDAGRYRDALGVALPSGLPSVFVEPATGALTELVARYARTHGPHTAEEAAARFALGVAPIEAALRELAESGRVVEGEYRPRSLVPRLDRAGREWCDSGVLRMLRQRSLAKLRHEVEPVDQAALARLYLDWQRVAAWEFRPSGHEVIAMSGGRVAGSFARGVIGLGGDPLAGAPDEAGAGTTPRAAAAVAGGARPVLTRRGASTGSSTLIEVVAQLQGAAIPASVLEREVLPSRIPGYEAGDVDQVVASGEVIWTGADAIGQYDGRIRLFLADRAPFLLPVSPNNPATDDGRRTADDRPVLTDQQRTDGPDGPTAQRLGDPTTHDARWMTSAGPKSEIRNPKCDAVRAFLARRGASFFPAIHQSVGGMPRDVLDALWELVWAGEMTNDTLQPLRAYQDRRRLGLLPRQPAGRRRIVVRGFQPASQRAGAGDLRVALPEAAGRWSLVASLLDAEPSFTERQAARVQQLLQRMGVVTREAVQAEGVEGGFTAVYSVLKAMEEVGRVRRGYFVAGLGAAQFAEAAAVEQLRALREPAAADVPMTVAVLAATDPANSYGAALPWPDRPEGRRPMRAAGAAVVLVDGWLAAWASPGGSRRQLLTFAESAGERDPADVRRAVAAALTTLPPDIEHGRRKALLIDEVDGHPAAESPMAAALEDAGFTRTSRGMMYRG